MNFKMNIWQAVQMNKSICMEERYDLINTTVHYWLLSCAIQNPLINQSCVGWCLFTEEGVI